MTPLLSKKGCSSEIQNTIKFIAKHSGFDFEIDIAVKLLLEALEDKMSEIHLRPVLFPSILFFYVVLKSLTQITSKHRLTVKKISG